MSRFNPHLPSDPIYSATEVWRDRCLIADGSCFVDGASLWVGGLLDELDKLFVQNPDEGEGDFLSKLKAQIAPGSAGCKQLMAELLWLLLLFSSNTGAERKREIVREIWSWSGSALNEDHPLLSDGVLGGIGSTGTAYNTQRWRELGFLLTAVRDFKRRNEEQRRELLRDPWAFAAWLTSVANGQLRQLRHILPHLLFPDSFERISSGQDKRAIVSRYTDTPLKVIKTWDRERIDRTLLDIRERLEKEHGSKIDFYQDEFGAEWQSQSKYWLLTWNPSKWSWETLVRDRATTVGGGKVEMSWRCSSTKPSEGDRVFLVRAGLPPKGIVAAGKVTRASYEDTHWDRARAEAGERTRFINVAFDQVRDASIDKILPLERLQEVEPEQEWNPQSSGIQIKEKSARALERMWRELPVVAGTQASVDVGPTVVPATSVTPLNLILYGPPGTGKTYRLMRDHLPLYQGDGEDRFEFITFHQSYAYEDFVEGIRPGTVNGGITYEVQPGVLKRLCQRARRAPDKRFALFVDEINRGNIAKIFGELISLVEVDKRIRTDASGARVPGCRGLEVTLPYSGERFGVPSNVDIIGTMNTADRSIALLDSALRRRFRFEELTPRPELLGKIDDGAGNVIDLRHLLEAMNRRLERLLHRDQILGHSYFYHVKTFVELRKVFAHEVLPFLQEAFYEDWRQVRLVLADHSADLEDQLVRLRPLRAEELFPGADSLELVDGESFEVIRETEITPDSIRKIYERLE
jgi:5-methylcytosine-specific restriction enzyme B